MAGKLSWCNPPNLNTEMMLAFFSTVHSLEAFTDISDASFFIIVVFPLAIMKLVMHLQKIGLNVLNALMSSV